MDKYVSNPNLPENKVSMGIIDGRARDSVLSSLKASGIEVILTDKCDTLYEAVSFHPDMFMHHLGGKDIVAAPNSPLATIRKLISKGFNIIEGQCAISRKYPEDTAYNVARIGGYAVCNTSHTDRILLNCLSDSGIRIIDVKQGYAKCSICIVNENSIITSDEGIYKTLVKYDFDILKINPGFIELPGLDYGFIGGVSGFISRDTLAFAGNVMLHPDFEKIQKFLSKYGKNVRALDNQKLLDIGTFIPLKEYYAEEIC